MLLWQLKLETRAQRDGHKETLPEYNWKALMVSFIKLPTDILLNAGIPA